MKPFAWLGGRSREGDYTRRVKQALRRDVLQILAAARREGVDEVNHIMLLSAACRFGPRPSPENMDDTLDWLKNKKLVALRAVGEFRIAALTELGVEVAAGRVRVDGVPRLPVQTDG